MILNIIVENFRSYNEPQTLSLIATEKNGVNSATIGELDVRKSAVIYGANGSGKSNLIKAILAMTEILRNDLKPSSTNDINNLMAFNASFFNNEKPIRITLVFSIKLEIYVYSIAYDKNHIIEEKLLNSEEKIIFSRKKSTKTNNEYIYKIPRTRQKLILNKQQLAHADSLLKQIQLSTSDKRLFLRQLVDNNCKELESVFTTITQNIVIRTNPYLKASPALMDTHFAIEYNKNKNKDLIADLNKIGLDIINLKQVTLPNNQKKFVSEYLIKNKVHELDFFNDESDGTIKYYSHNAMLNIIKQNDGVLIIDELDTHFHPLLVEDLIKSVHNNKSNAQIIFTTHNPIFLTPTLFEKDQIYFAEKNTNKATELYSLNDFNETETDNKWIVKYISGNFGAIPNIKTLK